MVPGPICPGWFGGHGGVHRTFHAASCAATRRAWAVLYAVTFAGSFSSLADARNARVVTTTTSAACRANRSVASGVGGFPARRRSNLPWSFATFTAAGSAATVADFSAPHTLGWNQRPGSMDTSDPARM
jgi:hypothetical protein